MNSSHYRLKWRPLQMQLSIQKSKLLPILFDMINCLPKKLDEVSKGNFSPIRSCLF